MMSGCGLKSNRLSFLGLNFPFIIGHLTRSTLWTARLRHICSIKYRLRSSQLQLTASYLQVGEHNWKLLYPMLSKIRRISFQRGTNASHRVVTIRTWAIPRLHVWGSVDVLSNWIVGARFFSFLFEIWAGNWVKICPPKQSHSAIRHNVDPVSIANSK